MKEQRRVTDSSRVYMYGPNISLGMGAIYLQAIRRLIDDKIFHQYRNNSVQFL